MSAVERLLAIEAIRTLKARYFRCVDTKDWIGLAQVFAAEIVFDRGFGHAVQDTVSGEWSVAPPPRSVLVHGRGAVLAMVREAIGEVATVHHGYNAEIHIHNADVATGIWGMSDELRDRSGQLILAGHGHYHDTYCRTDDAWRISASKLTRVSIVLGGGIRQ